jgi:hypothetical protein
VNPRLENHPRHQPDLAPPQECVGLAESWPTDQENGTKCRGRGSREISGTLGQIVDDW